MKILQGLKCKVKHSENNLRFKKIRNTKCYICCSVNIFNIANQKVSKFLTESEHANPKRNRGSRATLVHEHVRRKIN